MAFNLSSFYNIQDFRSLSEVKQIICTLFAMLYLFVEAHTKGDRPFVGLAYQGKDIVFRFNK